jgi:hypothetical protein
MWGETTMSYEASDLIGGIEGGQFIRETPAAGTSSMWIISVNICVFPQSFQQ